MPSWHSAIACSGRSRSASTWSRRSLRGRYRKPIAFMRLFHYPPDSNVEQKEFGAAEHKDYGFLTILSQDSKGGLEVRSPGGEMVGVPPRPDAFIINIGDMLSEITARRIPLAAAPGDQPRRRRPLFHSRSSSIPTSMPASIPIRT